MINFVLKLIDLMRNVELGCNSSTWHYHYSSQFRLHLDVCYISIFRSGTVLSELVRRRSKDSSNRDSAGSNHITLNLERRDECKPGAVIEPALCCFCAPKCPPKRTSIH